MAAAFTNAQTTAFFENGPQMALSPVACQRLAQEGLTTVDDFADFKEEQLDDAIKNLRVSIPGVAAVLDGAGNVVTPAIPAIPPCLVPARCALRLKVASLAYHYYLDIGRTPSPACMNYSLVLRDFNMQWESIKKLSEENNPDVPMLSKNVTPLKWMESFRDCLLRTFGVRSCPVSYVIRADVNVVPELNDPLLPGCSYGASGSVMEELISRLNHTDSLYQTDNALVFSLLDEATRNTIYYPTIKPFARAKDGRGAWNALIASHAGDDKWENLRKEKTNFLMNTKWNGRVYSLEKFTGLHRSSYVMLQEAALHVNFQLPTEHSRVGFLLDNITNQDPDLRAALASIRINTNGMRANFEQAVAFLLPVCPYSKFKSKQRQAKYQAQVSDVTLKGRCQKTGVEFRWHTKEEYSKLNKDQRKTLYDWQQTNEGKEAKDKFFKNKKKGLTKKQLAAKVSALEKKISDASSDTPKDDDVPSMEEIKAIISSVATAPSPTVPPLPPPPSQSNKRKPDADPATVAAVAIQDIIKRAKRK